MITSNLDNLCLHRFALGGMYSVCKAQTEQKKFDVPNVHTFTKQKMANLEGMVCRFRGWNQSSPFWPHLEVAERTYFCPICSFVFKRLQSIHMQMHTVSLITTYDPQSLGILPVFTNQPEMQKRDGIEKEETWNVVAEGPVGGGRLTAVAVILLADISLQVTGLFVKLTLAGVVLTVAATYNLLGLALAVQRAHAPGRLTV